MDPLQSALDSDELRACLELELVTRVNDVGVDVNFCLEHPHGVGMLPFICGLGPRKAMFLLKVIQRAASCCKTYLYAYCDSLLVLLGINGQVWCLHNTTQFQHVQVDKY